MNYEDEDTVTPETIIPDDTKINGYSRNNEAEKGMTQLTCEAIDRERNSEDGERRFLRLNNLRRTILLSEQGAHLKPAERIHGKRRS